VKKKSKGDKDSRPKAHPPVKDNEIAMPALTLGYCTYHKVVTKRLSFTDAFLIFKKIDVVSCHPILAKTFRIPAYPSKGCFDRQSVKLHPPT
jgi:hypothetical protein